MEQSPGRLRSEGPLHLLIAGEDVLVWIDDRAFDDLIDVANGSEEICNAGRCDADGREGGGAVELEELLECSWSGWIVCVYEFLVDIV